MSDPASRPLVPDEVAALESVMAQGWPARQVVPLGQWRLRASGGFTSRGNSVLCVGDPGVSRERAVALTGDWYAARGLPAIFALPTDVAGSPYDTALADLLAGSGADRAQPTVAMTAPVSALPHPLPRTARQATVTWSAAPDPAWLAAFGRYRTVPPEHTEVARAILTGSPGQRFYAVAGSPGPAGQPDPGLLASARVAVHDGWAGLHAMWVDPGHRRRGLATAVVAALARDIEAGGLPGVSRVYLQVERANVGAIAAYEGMGFTTHHGHVYLRHAGAAGEPDRC